MGWRGRCSHFGVPAGVEGRHRGGRNCQGALVVSDTARIMGGLAGWDIYDRVVKAPLFIGIWDGIWIRKYNSNMAQQWIVPGMEGL